MFNQKLKIVDILDWDTNFFGLKIAQFNDNKLNQENLKYAFKFCKQNKVRLLQFKCEASDVETIHLAEANGFHLADIRVKLKREIEPTNNQNKSLSENYKFRIASSDDIYILKQIVNNLYVHSRYYNDNNFSKSAVSNFYKIWIENSVRGKFDDIAYIVCNESLPVGFCTLKFTTNNCAKIGLFGVDKNQLGKGIGYNLLKNVLIFLEERKINNIRVTTQGTNYYAQRLYQKVGFKIEKFEIFYHCWL